MAAVSEIITKFSFEGSTKPLIDYNSALGKSVKLLGAMGVALGAAAFGVAKWASGVSQALQPLFDLSSQTGVAVASLQELSFAAEQSNSSSQALESSIGSLSAKIGEAAQKGSEEFSRLGISVRDANGNVKDADAILGEVGNSFRRLGLSMAEQQGFAEALGIDSSLITMLGKTGAEIDALKERARDLGITLSPKDQKALEEYNGSIAEMDAAMSGLKNKIAVAIVPELEDLAEGFSDLLAKNNEWIVDGVKATVEFVVDLVDALKRLAPFILASGAAFAIATIGTSGFAAALGFVLSPAVLITAGILAIALVLDDLIVAFRGGESVIADFFGEFFGWDIRPLLEGIVVVFKEVVGGILGGAKIIFDALKPIAPLIAVVGAAFVAATVGPALFAGALALITSPITLIIAGVAGILWAVNDLSKAFRGGESVIANFFEEFLGFDIRPVLVGIVEGFKAAFATVTNLVSGLFGGMVKIFSGIGDILSGNFSEGFEKIGEGFMEIIDSWAEAFRSIFGGVFDWLKQKALDILPDWAVKLIGGVGDVASGAADIVGDVASGAANIAGDVASGAANIAGDVASGAANIAGDVGNWVGGLFGGKESGEDGAPMPTPVPDPTSQSHSQALQPGGAVTNVGGASSRVEQTVNMEIRTSDPERAGKAASDGLQRQLEDARTQTRGRGGR